MPPPILGAHLRCMFRLRVTVALIDARLAEVPFVRTLQSDESAALRHTILRQDGVF